MSAESDSELSEFEVERNLFNKLKEKMKSLGFQEGMEEGRNKSLQEGFDIGYSDGFRIGERLGVAKGLVRCQTSLGITIKNEIKLLESRLDGSPNQPCLLCPESKKIKQQMDDKIYSVEFEEVISRQQKYCDEIIQNLTDPKISGVT